MSDDTFPLERFACFHATAQCELLFAPGCGVENSQFADDTLTTRATGYLAREASYRRDAARTALGDRGLPDPRAMSGSLIWETRFVETSSQVKAWSPPDAVVTGLQ
jgi:hypothetical protein